MARYAYDRLSAQDASFLWAEQANQPMHVAALALFETGPLAREGGGVDIERYRRAIEGVLHWIPRYRQRLEWTPIEGWPVWVDDRQFDLGYHVRHLALPRPGSREQLQELAARINARPLDRRHPLWEVWVIEGVEDGAQFAILNKVHHCMIDGAAGADLSQILMSPSSKEEPNEAVPYLPRPAPTPAELLRDSIGRGVSRPFEALRAALATNRDAGAQAGEPGFDRRLRGMREMVGFALRPASETPINGTLGPHRRLEWFTMPLEDVKEVRQVLGCTVNDVVLATVAGAMRRYFFRRRVDHRRLEFRVAAPVSTRKAEHDRAQGNHVSTWIVPLPLGIDEPLGRVAAIRETTEQLKRSDAALAVDTLMQVAEFLPPALIAQGTNLASGPANMIVTNVPGPQFPLYTVGARLLGMYPMVPLLPGGGLGVALFSYEGKLCWGFNADYELVPDIGAFVGDVGAAFEELRAAAVAQFIERRTAAAEQPPTVASVGRSASRERGPVAGAAKPARGGGARAQSAARAPSGSEIAATRQSNATSSP